MANIRVEHNSTRSRQLKIWFWAIATVLLWPSSPQAYFIDSAHGVRPAGMGEAFVGVADDANTVLFNPAGYAKINTLEVISMYSDLYSGLNVRLYNQTDDHFGYNFISLAYPLEVMQGSLGASWINFNTVFYQENVVILSGGTQALRAITKPLGFLLDTGVSLKYMQWRVDGSEYLDTLPTSDRGRYGLTADIGMLAIVFPGIKVGMAMENIIPANVGLLTTEYVPSIYRLGSSYIYQFVEKHLYLDSLMGTVEVSLRDQIYTLKVGVESWWFNRLVGVRAGANADQMSAGISVSYPWPATPLIVQADYAFSYPFYLADTMGSHRVGLMLNWDLKAAKPKPIPTPAVESSAVRAVKLAKEAAESARRALVDLGTARATDPAAAAAMGNSCLARAEEAEQIAGLAAKVATPDMETTTPTAEMLALSEEAQNALQTAHEAVEKIRTIIQNLPPITANMENRETISFSIPEKHPDKIVIGIENRIVEDFGGMREVEPIIKILGEYLRGKVRMPVDWKFLTSAELQLAFRQGELDFLAVYESDMQSYAENKWIQPAATVRARGRQAQSCYLLVRDDASITSLNDLLGKRLGYCSPEIISRLKTLFFPLDPDFKPGAYFKEIKKQRNSRDGLWALQMEAVDAIAEYDYILEIAERIPEIKVRIIAQSPVKANARIFQRTSQYTIKSDAQKRLLDALFQFHQQPGSQTFLDYFGLERFVPANGE